METGSAPTRTCAAVALLLRRVVVPMLQVMLRNYLWRRASTVYGSVFARLSEWTRKGVRSWLPR